MSRSFLVESLLRDSVAAEHPKLATPLSSAAIMLPTHFQNYVIARQLQVELPAQTHVGIPPPLPALEPSLNQLTYAGGGGYMRTIALPQAPGFTHNPMLAPEAGGYYLPYSGRAAMLATSPGLVAAVKPDPDENAQQQQQQPQQARPAAVTSRTCCQSRQRDVLQPRRLMTHRDSEISKSALTLLVRVGLGRMTVSHDKSTHYV